MDQVYEILIHKVHDYEGTVNEMTGVEECWRCARYQQSELLGSNPGI